MAGVTRIIALLGITIVFSLGYWWGTRAGESMSNCITPKPGVGEIISVQKHEATTSQYRVQMENDCTLLVTTDRFPEYRRGAIIDIEGKTQTLAELPPELIGYATYLDRQGIDGTVRFAAITELEPGISTWQDRFSDTVTTNIQAVFSQPLAAVVVAMILGDYGMIPDELTEQFQQTGLTHILAISGFNITIIAGAIWVAVRFMPRSVRLVTMIVLIWGYITLIQFPISAVRAALFWTLLLLALEGRMLMSLTTVFILGAAAMITYDPSVVSDIGWQLSFAAVGGIALTLFLLPNITKRIVPATLLSSIGAALATWPIIAYHFGLITPFTIIANVLVVPVVPVFFVLAIIVVALQAVWPLLAVVFSIPVQILWQWIALVVSFFSELPGAVVTVALPAWVVAVWYLSIAIASLIVVKRQGRSWREVWQ